MESRITLKEYFNALKDNKLLGVKCKDCGFITAPPRVACRKCAGLDTQPVELSGKGKITTFTSIYVPPLNRRGRTPYLVIMVELDEGPWIIGNLGGVDPATASIDLIGKPVILKNAPAAESQDKSDPAPFFVLAEQNLSLRGSGVYLT